MKAGCMIIDGFNVSIHLLESHYYIPNWWNTMPLFARSLIRRVALVAFGLAVTCTAFAQKAALVQETYGPGRSPYQSNQLYNPSAQLCPNQFYCQIAFPVVPAGKRLVVTYVSATYSMNAGATEAIVSLGKGLFDTMDLPAPVNVGGNRYVASGPVTYYFEAGEIPYVFITGSSVVTNNTGHASVIGFLVPSL
jgi:hypothetical protein